MRLPYGTSLRTHKRSRLLVGEALASANLLGSIAGRPVTKRRHLALRRAWQKGGLQRLGPWLRLRQRWMRKHDRDVVVWRSKVGRLRGAEP